MSARAGGTHVNVRSHDGRVCNIVVASGTMVLDVRRRIAMEMGVPAASRHAMNIVVDSGVGRSPVTDDLATLGDLAARYSNARASAYRLTFIVDNCHTLAPKPAFDVVRILQHWMSPAMLTKSPYRAAIDELRQITERVVESNDDTRHALTPERMNRVFGRVARGLELVKKIGFQVTPAAFVLDGNADRRVVRVAFEHLNRQQARVPSPVPRRSALRVRRRLEDLLTMSYEALVRLEDVRVGLDRDLLETLPVQVMVDDRDVERMSRSDHPDCGICLETFAVGDRVMRLPCFHTFHEHCATTWLAGSKKCPNDMIEITADTKCD
ncbi:RING-type domain-containing protein [Plasmodiophora brassicae]